MLRIENTGKSQMKSRNRVRVFREILNHEGISRKQLGEAPGPFCTVCHAGSGGAAAGGAYM